jgi:fluoride exporter
MSNLVFVFIGGGLGSLLRYGIALALQGKSTFPFATFVANAAACVLLGAVLAWQLRHGAHDTARLFLATGVCGGFSTFSTFTAESVHLLQQGQTWTAVLYMVGSLLICILCLLLGAKLV